MAIGYTSGLSSSTDQLANMSSDQWQNYLSQQKTGSDRWNQLISLNNPNYNSSNGSNSNNSNSNGSSGGSSSSSSSSNDLLGGLDSNGLSDYTQQAKDLANFNLQNTEQQSTFDAGLRNTEADQDNARQMQQNDQTYGWQEKINNDTQNALSARLNAQLQNNSQLQQGQFDQQNNTIGRAVSLASTRLGG